MPIRTALIARLLSVSLCGVLWGCTGQIGTLPPGSGTGGSGSPVGAGGAPAGGGGSAAAGSGAGTGVGSSGGTGTGATAGTGAATGTGGGAGTVAPDPNAAGPMPLRRLTSREYLNTVRDLLADTTSVAADDVPGEADDISNNAFPFRQPTSISTVDSTNLELAAEALAKGVSTRLSTILPCTPANASAEAGCASQFITTFGLKAFRRPLSTVEVSDLNALYQTARTMLMLDFNGAIGVLAEAMLQSPGFLYHWELDPGPALRDGAVVQLGNYQIANRLSYYLWGSMPDAALFAAAAAGQLATADGVQTQAQRMLMDTKAQNMVADFVDDWMDVNTIVLQPKDPAFYSMWSPDLVTAMETEVRSFGTSVILGTGLFGDLFTSTKSSANQALAAIYGVTGITGTTPKAVTLDASQRGGILTLAGFLAVNGATDGSSPVRRGHAVLTRLLCLRVPDPPANVPPPSPPTPGLTSRQRFEQHDMQACTGACHAVMDPIGFGFERYDGIGRYRTTDQNLPVNSNGSIVLDGQTHAFADAVALGKLLAASAQVQSCLSTQVMRYALNRWETGADAASIESARTAFQAGGLNIRTLMTSVATSRTFRYRSPASGEVLP
jgi:hypothetical protein